MRSRQLATSGHMTFADDSVLRNCKLMLYTVSYSLLFKWASRSRPCALDSPCPLLSGSGEGFICPDGIDGIDGNQTLEGFRSPGSLETENEQQRSMPGETEEYTGLVDGGPHGTYEHLHGEPHGGCNSVSRLVVSSLQCARKLKACLKPLRRADIASDRVGSYKFKCSYSMC